MRTCKGSMALGTGCGTCVSCKKYKRSVIYSGMIESIDKTIKGLESLNYPNFAAITHLKQAQFSLHKSDQFEFGVGKDYYQLSEGGKCRMTSNRCSESFVKNSPICMRCSGYLVRKKKCKVSKVITKFFPNEGELRKWAYGCRGNANKIMIIQQGPVLMDAFSNTSNNRFFILYTKLPQPCIFLKRSRRYLLLKLARLIRVSIK